MTKATEEMLALADKIEYAIKTEGEITLFETNGTRVVYVLRSLAAQSAGEPPTARETALEKAALDFIAKVDRGEARSTNSYAAFKAALSVPPGDQAREAWMESDDIRKQVVTQSLASRSTDLRRASAQCRKAYTKDFMNVPMNWLADAYDAAANVLSARLAIIASEVKKP